MSKHTKQTKAKKAATPKQLNALQKERDEYLEGWKRAKADLANMRARFEKDRDAYQAMAGADLVEQILPVLDNFTRAFDDVPEEIAQDPWVKGVEFIHQQLQKILEDNGVTQIQALDADFDPMFHESVGEEKKKGKAGKVVRVERVGYMMNDRVLRPAHVIVGSSF